VVTSGGRVLGVTGLGADVGAARDKVYSAIEKISFEGMHYRKDIAERALKRK
jgi:phosphoribosylamine--glycine ligase